MAKQVSPKRLKEFAMAHLPKGIPAEAIESVECDPWDGTEGGYSYWVYLRTHYQYEPGCHTIHEDTLREIADALWSVQYVEDDDGGYGNN